MHTCISDWAFWTGSGDHATLTSGTFDLIHTHNAVVTKADLARELKPSWKRRLDLYGRSAAEVLARTIKPNDNPHVVFCSRHGNIDRTVKLLHQVITREVLSPADFSMSVHNALVGIASINWSITESHTAVAAGQDSLLNGLTEALCQLQDVNSPVIMCYVDLPLPDIYKHLEPDHQLGAALAIRFDRVVDTPQTNTYSFRFNTHSNDKSSSLHQDAERFAGFLTNGAKTLVLSGTSGCWEVLKNG